MESIKLIDLLDDEFRQLERQVRALFGEQACNAAIERALVTLRSSTTPDPRERIMTFQTALKAELRRLIAPQ